MDLKDCIPTHKMDDEAVVRAAKLGFPGLNPILPDLLEWLQDINWPVAQGLVPVLARAGSEIVPHLKAIFDGDDDSWKWYVIGWLVRELDEDVKAQVRSDIVRIATNPTPGEKHEEVDEQASDLLEGWPELK